MNSPTSRFERIAYMAGLIIAGEAIFGLPFHVARFFRPTVLEVFAFTHTELGSIQAAYGVIAMLAYFPGGPLADIFSARRLMTASLIFTALGGLYFATIPGYTGMLWLWGFWGLTTILLFWAALIRATREWGHHDEQGLAYGILDGGRGLLSASVASVAVILFGFFLPDQVESASAAQREAALRNVILIYTGVTLAAAVLIWLVVPEREPAQTPSSSRTAWRQVPQVLRMPAVWLQALIVVCAYVAYKGFDFYSLYAVDAYAMNEVEAAQVSTVASWVRPFAPILIGLLGDRILSSRAVSLCFMILIVSYVFLATYTPEPSALWLLFGNIIVICIAFYGLRGVYFALFEEARIPKLVTGTAVGIVSFIGYTPDIFVAPLGGYFLDSAPGLAGHQHLFLFLAGVMVIGLIASWAFRRLEQTPGRLTAGMSE